MRVMWLSDRSSLLNDDESVSLTAPLERALTEYYSDQIRLAVVFESEYEGQARTVRGITTYYPVNADINQVAFSYQNWERTKAKLLRVVEDYQPDIIHCFGSEWPYGALAESVAVPVVIHMMGFLNTYYPALDMVRGYCAIPADSPGKAPEQRPEDKASAFERRIMKANHYFMGRTEWDKNIVKYYSPGANYYHVPEAIKPRIYGASGRWKYHYNHGKLRLLTISSADDRKGNEIILRTAQILKELLKIDFEWRVAGSRVFFPFFEQRTGINHQDVNMNLLGRIDTRQVVEELSAADFFIHASIIDNSPNTVCEAQLIGCPVIASNVGGVPQLIEDSVTGFLYPYNEPHTLAFLIGNLYREEAVLTRISQSETEIARKRHDPKLVGDAVVHTYESVIKDWESRPRAQPNVLDRELPAAPAATVDERIPQTEKPAAAPENIEAKLAYYKEYYLAAINQREELKRQLTEARYAYSVISNAACWKMTAPLRAVLDWLKRFPAFALFVKGLKCLKENGIRYTWKKVKDKLRRRQDSAALALLPLFTPEELKAQRAEHFDREIKFSIITPLYNTPEDFLREMIRSVLDQTYANWELCMADGSDAEHSEVERICREYAKKDRRVKYRKLEKNLGISGNSNACLEMATGDYICLLDHDDLLHPAALHEVMRAICEQDADFVYTDEKVFHKTPGDAHMPHFKPSFAPDTLLSNNYICHFSLFRRSLLDKVGTFDPACNGSQDHDMILRLTEQASQIVHIPKILYFWRAHSGSVAQSIGVKSYVLEAGIRAVDKQLQRMGLEGKADLAVPGLSIYRIRYALRGTPRVSILIPNYEHLEDLKKCLLSVFEKTSYPNYEIVIVENNSSSPEIFRYYAKLQTEHKNLRVVEWSGKFNYSAINNYGAQFCTGEYILLLNNDTLVITSAWIEEMLMFAQRGDVGAVGVKLFYPDHTIQHAGVCLGLGGVAGRFFSGVDHRNVGYMGRLIYAQNLSAVSAACMMVRRDVWDEVGGLDETFSVEFNDVDLCMRIRKAGYLIVWTPYAELYHYESRSRGSDDTPEKQQRHAGEVRRFQERWAKELAAGDPYYNPNLTLDRGDFSLR